MTEPTYCLDPACCNPPGFHGREETVCPHCGSVDNEVPRPPAEDGSPRVACFRCPSAWYNPLDHCQEG